MRGVRIGTIALVVPAVILVGCSRETGGATPAATLGAASSETASAPAQPPTETESEASDPYAIPADPADIDEAYVERVLTELTRPISAATRMIVRKNRVTSGAKRVLASTHRGEALAGILDAYRDALKASVAKDIFSASAEPVGIKVRRIVGATKTCVFAVAMQDTSGLAKQEIEPFPTYYQIEAKASGDDPEGRNPTPWMIVVDALPRDDGREYRNPCA